MTKFIALLRGVNVGGNNKVEMPKLKKCFESLGHQNVIPYINSGNIIFESSTKDTGALTHVIEQALKKQFGFEIKVVVRDSKSMQKVCNAIPTDWKNDATQKTDVLFLWDEFDAKKSIKLVTTTPGVDTLIYVPGALIWNVQRSSYTKSGMKKFIGTIVYKHMTARNVNTVRKLASLL